MKAATLFIIAISHAAHWLSGTNATVQVSWAAPAPVAAAVVEWELRFDGAGISSGRAPLPDAKQRIEIQIAAPIVRVRTTLQWKYRVVRAAGGADIEAGSIPISMYPVGLLGDYSKAYASRSVVLVDRGMALSRLLTAAKVPFTRLDDVSGLATLRPNVVVIAEDMLDNGPFAQGSLLALAKSGAQVMVFRQSQPDTLFGYRLEQRNIVPGFAWKLDHSLLAGFDAEDAASFLIGDRQALAIELPADEPALELGYWIPEAPANHPGPIDALLMTRRYGAGRVVLCQIPMGDWDDDPRAQLLLDNILNYLSTRPEPTPRPSERILTMSASKVEWPTIRISPGGHP